MLLLPRIDDSTQAAPSGQRAAVEAKKTRLPGTLGSCMHLFGGMGGVGADFMDLESVRQRKLARMRPDDRVTSVSMQAPQKASAARTAEKRRYMEKLAPVSTYESSVVRPKMNMNSLSRAGVWYDSRATDDGALCVKLLGLGNISEYRGRQTCPDTYSDGEKFILKRWKELLMRRYGSLPGAYKRIDNNNSGSLTVGELCEAMSGVMQQSEVKIIKRLLDKNGDAVVSIDEFIGVLGEV